jgi:hypothetical protein
MTSEYQNDECKASDTEEPGAVILHAGICAGAVGQLAVLPRFIAVQDRPKHTGVLSMMGFDDLPD